jgi:hypothetical protein
MPNANVVMGCKTEEHIFWDCKRYENQEATVMDILSENSKKRIPQVSDIALKARKKKDFCEAFVAS